eukprot:m.53250 g.53250  ORF g.53250 m.53250 type:complete len:149 (+) comp34242_c0_seq15:718-1164(+)
MSLLAPKTTTYEWMGPVGSLFMMTGLPTVVYLLYFACNAQSCSLVDIPRIQLPPLGQWISQEAAIVFLAWLAFQAVIYAVNVGKIVKGSKLRDGSRLDYRINGERFPTDVSKPRLANWCFSPRPFRNVQLFSLLCSVSSLLVRFGYLE